MIFVLTQRVNGNDDVVLTLRLVTLIYFDFSILKIDAKKLSSGFRDKIQRSYGIGITNMRSRSTSIPINLSMISRNISRNIF